MVLQFQATAHGPPGAAHSAGQGLQALRPHKVGLRVLPQQADVRRPLLPLQGLPCTDLSPYRGSESALLLLIFKET